MSNQFDLHMHSDVSNDGQFSPSELMQLCKQSGLTTVSLTDHNSIRGIAEAQKTAIDLGLEFIHGTELDCHCQGVNLHLLGYGINPAVPEFESNEMDLLNKEQAASSRLIQLVQELGIIFDVDSVMDLSIQGVVTGEMIAEVALEDKRNLNNPLLKPYRGNGARSDNPYVNFYWDFCSQGKPAYVPIQFMHLEQAIHLIKRAGGLAVLAHPGINIGLDQKKLEGIIACGIDGIEVYSSYHDSKERNFFKEQASSHHLLKTLGSDFHGKTKPAIKLGHMSCPQEEEIYAEFMRKLNFVQCI